MCEDDTEYFDEDYKLIAEVDAAYEKINNGTAAFASNEEVNKMMADKIELLRDSLKKISCGVHSGSSEALLISKVLESTK